jgi:hypothetical protein
VRSQGEGEVENQELRGVFWDIEVSRRLGVLTTFLQDIQAAICKAEFVVQPMWCVFRVVGCAPSPVQQERLDWKPLLFIRKERGIDTIRTRGLYKTLKNKETSRVRIPRYGYSDS